MKIDGPVFSIITPFQQDERIDWNALQVQLDNLAFHKVKQIYVMPYCSRYSLLSVDEIIQLNSFVSRHYKQVVPDSTVIVANPILGSWEQTLEVAIAAKQNKADVFSVILQEKIFNEKQVVSFFELISDISGIPILIHEQDFVCGKTGQIRHWDLDTLEYLCSLDNIVAIKEDAKDDKYTKEVIKRVKDKVSIIISGKGKAQWLKFADQGCQAWLTGVACAAPKVAQVFYQAYLAGNKKKCSKIIQEIERKFYIIKQEFGYHIAIKAVMELEGLMKRWERRPMIEVSDKDMKKIEKVWNSIDWKVLYRE